MPAPQVLRTTQRLTSTQGEAFGWESFTGIDGAGKKSYATSVDLTGHVVEYDGSKFNQFAVAPDGTAIRIPVVIFMAGDAGTVPAVEDRITLSDARVFFVAEKVPVHGLYFTRAAPDHYKLKLKAAG